MNAGFSSLTVLKALLLPEALRESTEYDRPLTAIGLGAAAAFEKFCNRQFLRTVGATHICSADRDHCFLPRYPVESVPTVEVKLDEASGFTAQTGVILTRNDPAGYVFWGGNLGPHWASIRLTYTGGYWWDTSEDASETLPTGATELPDDLFLAWTMQCEDFWKKKDRLGISIAIAPDKPMPDTEAKILPHVQAILSGYIRYAIS